MKKTKLNSTNPKYSKTEETKIEYRRELIKEVEKIDYKGNKSTIRVSALFIK
ncbi:hypothetical protein [uncultured Mediterranean phage uvDeep-CGR2-KM19-C269]|nr:hypothetical protein [uncultured Mediterranean phage uvDeep-CGR2-KM19-C269]